MARPRKNLRILTEEEARLLSSMIESDSVSDTVRNRCRVLLEMCGGKHMTYMECAERLGIAHTTVGNIVRAFGESGVEAVTTLNRNPNSNIANLKVTPRIESLIVSMARRTDRSWSLRSLAAETLRRSGVSIGKDTIAKILKKHRITI